MKFYVFPNKKKRGEKSPDYFLKVYDGKNFAELCAMWKKNKDGRTWIESSAMGYQPKSNGNGQPKQYQKKQSEPQQMEVPPFEDAPFPEDDDILF